LVAALAEPAVAQGVGNYTYSHSRQWSGRDLQVNQLTRDNPLFVESIQGGITECEATLDNGVSFMLRRVHFLTPDVIVTRGVAVQDVGDISKSGRYMMAMIKKDGGWHYTDFYIHWTNISE
jgi:hypothetical protein